MHVHTADRLAGDLADARFLYSLSFPPPPVPYRRRRRHSRSGDSSSEFASVESVAWAVRPLSSPKSSLVVVPLVSQPFDGLAGCTDGGGLFSTGHGIDTNSTWLREHREASGIHANYSSFPSHDPLLHSRTRPRGEERLLFPFLRGFGLF